MRRKAYTVSENYIWVTKGVVQKLLSDRKRGGRGWNFSHLRFSYAKKDLIKFLNFIIKKKQITSPLHSCCTQLLVKRVLSNGFSFLSGTFLNCCKVAVLSKNLHWAVFDNVLRHLENGNNDESVWCLVSGCWCNCCCLWFYWCIILNVTITLVDLS